MNYLLNEEPLKMTLVFSTRTRLSKRALLVAN